MKVSKFLFLMACLFLASGCGPSPESAAKKYCNLYKKYQEAINTNDAINILKYASELDSLNNKVQIDNKGNSDWLTTYALNRDACVLEEMKKNSK